MTIAPEVTNDGHSRTIDIDNSIIIASVHPDDAKKKLEDLLEKYSLNKGLGGEATYTVLKSGAHDITFRYPQLPQPVTVQFTLDNLPTYDRDRQLRRMINTGLGVLNGKLNLASDQPNSEVLTDALESTPTIVHSNEDALLFHGPASHFN